MYTFGYSETTQNIYVIYMYKLYRTMKHQNRIWMNMNIS